MSEIKALEKLRESSHIDDDKWTLANGEVVFMFNNEPKDPDAINWGEQWRKIADEIEAEIAERFMEAPVDADGVPTKPGDKMKTPGGVVTVLSVNRDNFFVNKVGRPGILFTASCYSHAKPRTIEDVLADLANEVWETSCTCQTTWSDSGLDVIEKRYADEIRAMFGEVDE